MTVRAPRTAIDDHVESWEKYVGLAKAAAKKPIARADIDAEFYLSMAEKGTKKHIPLKLRQEIHEAFLQSMPERIERLKEVIKRYEGDDNKQARDQLEWYTRELERLKALKR